MLRIMLLGTLVLLSALAIVPEAAADVYTCTPVDSPLQPAGCTSRIGSNCYVFIGTLQRPYCIL